jgi:hypothetical protein
MKGITLQYTEEERVFFSDVAGIGDAKVFIADCRLQVQLMANCERRNMRIGSTKTKWMTPASRGFRSVFG